MNRIIRFACCSYPLAAMILSGCSITLPPLPSTPASPHIVSTVVAQYRAYGDSITYGATLSDPEVEAYPAWVATVKNVTLANNAIPSDQACDIAARQIFPNEDSPTLFMHPTYSLLIGTNDVVSYGIGAYESVYVICHRAAISWLAIPIEHKVLANSGNSVTTSGAGSLDTSNHWNAWKTQEEGASISFSIITTGYGPIYAWPRIEDSSPATYSYSVDGVVIGTGSMQTMPKIATRNGTVSSLGFLRLPPVPAGTHLVRFTQTNPGTDGLSVVGIGTPTGISTDIVPTVLVGTIPFGLNDAKGTACRKYNQDIMADVNDLAEDGLKVKIFDTRDYMFGTSREMDDMWHPNALGQYELSAAVEASW